MKKILLKIIIGIIAVPTVIIGGLYIAREIPVVNEKIIVPLAQLTSNIGIPIIKPKYTDDMLRNQISILKERYYVSKFDCPGDYPNSQVDSINQWLEKIGCMNDEGEVKNVKAVNNLPGFGTEFFALLYSEDEGYNLTWREYLEMYLKIILGKTITKADIERALEIDSKEDIPIYNSQSGNSDSKDVFDKKVDLTEQLQEAMQSGDTEKQKQIKQQLEEVNKEIEEYIRNHETTVIQ